MDAKETLTSYHQHHRHQSVRILIAPPSASLKINARKEAARNFARSTVMTTSAPATLATE